jgi:D-psicose/D-tagatose/L-ribulose 3-epimerase
MNSLDTLVKMRLGCCISNGDHLAALERSGADYCELPVARALMDGDATFQEWADRMASSAVPAGACNVFLPSGLPVVGPEVDPAVLRGYVETALARMERLGARVLVVGSGGARNVPDGFDRDRALDQFEELLRSVASHAAEHGVTVALEPLRPQETNLLNTVTESAEFLRARDAGGARLLADLYHMREQGEPLAVLGPAADLLVHVHVAGVGRRPPASDAGDLEPFLRQLREAGYRGDCSIECSWSDFAAQAPAAVGHLRAVAGRAGWSVPHAN